MTVELDAVLGMLVITEVRENTPAQQADTTLLHCALLCEWDEDI